MAVLYRKYRPQTFSDVVGQKHIIQTLQNQVKNGQVAHAYLFTGSRGTGKTSLARILAKAVNCRTGNQLISQSVNQGIRESVDQGSPSLSRWASGHLPQEGEKDIEKATPYALGDACGVCEFCKQIENGNFVDLVEIDAASNTGVDNVRDIIEQVRFSPALGAYKVFIVDEVHMLSKAAFNALLKTLEEPPKHAIFVLATTEISKVPATIISRTQRFDFKPFTEMEICSRLEKILQLENLFLAPEALELVAKNSGGGLRDALSLLEKALSLGSNAPTEDIMHLLGVTDMKLCEELLGLIAEKQAGSLPLFFSKLSEKGQDMSVFNRDLLEYLRKILVIKILGTNNQDSIGGFENLVQAYELSELMLIIRLFLRSYKEISQSSDPELPVLLAAVEAALRQGGKVQKNTDSLALKEDSVSTEPKAKSVNPNPPQIQKTESLNNAESEAFAQVDFSEVQTVWPAFADSLKKINGPLANLVKTSELVEVSKGMVWVGVKFAFHKQSLDNAKNNEILRNTLSGLLGKKLGVGARVSSEVKEAAPEISDALKIFGGEVVE